MTMVAERSGRSCLMTLAMARPLRSWIQCATAKSVNTMVRCASIASRVRWSIGRASRSVSAIPERAPDMPEIVVFRDHLDSRHHPDVEVGDVAFQPDQRLGAGQAGLIEDA